jgi:hypothetical protein
MSHMLDVLGKIRSFEAGKTLQMAVLALWDWTTTVSDGIALTPPGFFRIC